jgi:protein-L-isoaspartate(D-aspartate) O-methyltransferase
MTDLLAPEPHETVLEIGTGLGYQTAVLAQLAAQVWSVEIVEELANHAELLLHRIGYSTVGIRVGDGSRGWTEHAPYDKILVTAFAEYLPPALLEQLKPGGRMVLPMGPVNAQRLTVVDKDVTGNTRIRSLSRCGSVGSRQSDHINNAMSTSMDPPLAAGRFEHGSILSRKFRAKRVRSQ